MKAMTFSEAAAAMGAQTTLAGSFDAVTTDTRAIAQDGLFIALRGERFDGHSFAAQALAQGAAAVVTERDLGLGERQLLVADTHRALLALAGYYRSLFQIPVIGVTGSVGKTTTKEMIHTVLSAKYNTLKNEGNLNNEIGVPLTLFRLEKAHEAAVIEMGMSGFGEIARMTRAVRPDAAVISNIGVSHIEKLGSQEGILRAKLEILDGMAPTAPLFLNGDDPLLATVRPGAHPVTFYGIEQDRCSVQALHLTSEGAGTDFALQFPGGTGRVSLPCPGRHNVYNALAAFAVGVYAGVEPQAAMEALRGYVPAGMRQRIRKAGGATFIEDCYNASPDSVAAALAVLAEMQAARRIAVLGDMLELGAVSEQAHATSGKLAAQRGVSILMTYGERSAATAQAARACGLRDVRAYDDKRQLADDLAAELRQGDAVLFKASRGMKLEDVIFALDEAIGGKDLPV